MKINTFARNEAGGSRATSLQDIEDELVTEIDEKRMSPAKRLVTRFLSFLSNRHLTLDKLKHSSKEEQSRLRKEFLGE